MADSIKRKRRSVFDSPVDSDDDENGVSTADVKVNIQDPKNSFQVVKSSKSDVEENKFPKKKRDILKILLDDSDEDEDDKGDKNSVEITDSISLTLEQPYDAVVVPSETDKSKETLDLLKNDFLHCSICLEIFRSPVLLPCLHRFCKECVTSALKVNRNLKCPHCRKTVPPKFEFKVDFTFESMISKICPQEIAKEEVEVEEVDIPKSSSSSSLRIPTGINQLIANHTVAPVLGTVTGHSDSAISRSRKDMLRFYQPISTTSSSSLSSSSPSCTTVTTAHGHINTTGISPAIHSRISNASTSTTSSLNKNTYIQSLITKSRRKKHVPNDTSTSSSHTDATPPIVWDLVSPEDEMEEEMNSFQLRACSITDGSSSSSCSSSNTSSNRNNSSSDSSGNDISSRASSNSSASNNDNNNNSSNTNSSNTNTNNNNTSSSSSSSSIEDVVSPSASSMIDLSACSNNNHTPIDSHVGSTSSMNALNISSSSFSSSSTLNSTMHNKLVATATQPATNRTIQPITTTNIETFPSSSSSSSSSSSNCNNDIYTTHLSTIIPLFSSSTERRDIIRRNIIESCMCLPSNCHCDHPQYGPWKYIHQTVPFSSTSGIIPGRTAVARTGSSNNKNTSSNNNNNISSSSNHSKNNSSNGSSSNNTSSNNNNSSSSNNNKKKEISSMIASEASASSHINTSGKWMLFPYLNQIDVAWSQAKLLMARNFLGTTAKVGIQKGDESKSKKTGLICMYTDDYNDVSDVFRVLMNLTDYGHFFPPPPLSLPLSSPSSSSSSSFVSCSNSDNHNNADIISSSSSSSNNYNSSSNNSNSNNRNINSNSSSMKETKTRSHPQYQYKCDADTLSGVYSDTISDADKKRGRKAPYYLAYPERINEIRTHCVENSYNNSNNSSISDINNDNINNDNNSINNNNNNNNDSSNINNSNNNSKMVQRVLEMVKTNVEERETKTGNIKYVCKLVARRIVTTTTSTSCSCSCCSVGTAVTTAAKSVNDDYDSSCQCQPTLCTVDIQYFSIE